MLLSEGNRYGSRGSRNTRVLEGVSTIVRRSFLPWSRHLREEIKEIEEIELGNVGDVWIMRELKRTEFLN